MAKRKVTISDLRTTARRTAARGEGLVSRVSKEAQQLLAEARKLRAEARRRAERGVHDIERSAGRMLGRVEARAARATEPVLGKSFASRRDLQRLTRRVEALEKELARLNARRSAA